MKGTARAVVSAVAVTLAVIARAEFPWVRAHWALSVIAALAVGIGVIEAVHRAWLRKRRRRQRDWYALPEDRRAR